jgi:hypothetical protein
MKKVYGIEMIKPSDKLPGFIGQIVKKTAEIVHVIDRDENVLIVDDEKGANDLINYYESKGILGETYNLYALEHPYHYPTFTDYGFISVSEKSYLFEETSIPFQINGGDDEQIKMAMLQFEEHLIGEERSQKKLYFVDRQLQELILGVAAAYKINVSFVSS